MINYKEGKLSIGTFLKAGFTLPAKLMVLHIEKLQFIHISTSLSWTPAQATSVRILGHYFDIMLATICYNIQGLPEKAKNNRKRPSQSTVPRRSQA